MSQHLAPSDLITETDPIKLAAMLRQKQLEQIELTKAGWQPNPQLSDSENEQSQLAFDKTLSKLVREQIGIIAILRKTSTGPAKEGGKRAKRAPIDKQALDDAIFS